MKKLNQIILLLQNTKAFLKSKYGLKNLALFGSQARGESTPLSDVDLLVEVESPIGLELVLLGDELENILGIKVDVVTPCAIKASMFESLKPDLMCV